MTPTAPGVVFVTGGAGYIGSHACKALKKRGFLPVTYDNLEHGHEWAVKWGPLEKGDIRDASRLSEVLLHWRPVAVLHFAAYCYVGESVEDPAKYYHNNLCGSLTLLSAMLAAKIDRIVFSSTCSVYGLPQTETLDESHRREPINPYGRTKFIIEDVLRDFSRAYDIRATALRYFNAAGADPDGEIGEAHSPEPHLIPRAIEAGLGRLSHIDIYGRDYDTPDGTCIRDYIHVSDLADAHVAALDLVANEGFSAINLGTGQGASVLEVIRAAERIIGKKIPVIDRARRPGDPDRLVAVAGKAGATLGWKPKLSGLDDIITTAAAWARRPR